MLSEDQKKLHKILESIEASAWSTLELSDDMKSVHKAQARIQVVKEITTQFFAEKKQINEHKTLRT